MIPGLQRLLVSRLGPNTHLIQIFLRRRPPRIVPSLGGEGSIIRAENGAREFMRIYCDFDGMASLNANPMGAAIALEASEAMPEGDNETMIMAKGGRILEGLRALQTRRPRVDEVDGPGLARRAKLCEADGFTRDKSLSGRTTGKGLRGDAQIIGERGGLGLGAASGHKHVGAFAPSLEISLPEIDLALKHFASRLRRCVA